MDPGAALLRNLGATVRRWRRERSWTRRDLAARTGISERFLADVETGRANPSVLRLLALAGAFDRRPDALLAAASPDPDPVGTIALLGLRGAGKSTVGEALARALDCPFVELDRRIEETTGLRLDEIFRFHGEGYYRRAEREALESVLAQRGVQVVACGGGIVSVPETFGMLLERAHTVWLRARPEDHWRRVVDQGDTRPMADNEQAFADLCSILAERESQYRRAGTVATTSGRGVGEIVEELRERFAPLLSPA